MTPKYYIGQKVLFDHDIYTIVEVMYADPVRVPGYKIANDEYVLHAVQYELKRPPAKLEFGYCADGDIIEDSGNLTLRILDVRENIFAYSGFELGGNTKYFSGWKTYKEANAKGWKIKREESIDKMLDKILEDDQQEALEIIYDQETITLNGKTYKLVE